MIQDLLQRLESSPDAETLISLLKCADFEEVFRYADRINRRYHGDVVDIRAIIEFSNICRRQCLYCGLNRTNTNIDRYRMAMNEIVETAIQAWEAGYQTVVLQSGEDMYYTKEILGTVISEIKKYTSIKITLSCGERNYEELSYLKNCGADRYLLKHETSSKDLYRYLHPCGTLQERTNCLKNIKKLGYETGSGFMIGLPDQTFETIAQDILLLRELRCDMAGIGPFISHPDTKLKGLPNGSTELTKRAVALARILLPSANLPATTSLGVLSKEEKQSIFHCGANVIMRKVTPASYVKLYEIYPGDIHVDNIVSERKELEQMLISIGKTPR